METLNAAAKERRLAEGKIISAKADVQSAKLMREVIIIIKKFIKKILNKKN